MMSQAYDSCSKYRVVLNGIPSALLSISLGLCSMSLNAQMAPIQLTNPAIDSANGDKTAAWVADENLGILYCELTGQGMSKAKRVVCFDSNGAVTPTGNGGLRDR